MDESLKLLQRLPCNPRIAVVRALQLGDLLCAVPALRALRHTRPDARIALVGLPWAKTFMDRFSHLIDEFLEFPGYPGIPEAPCDAARSQLFRDLIDREPFDLAIQIHGSGRHINDFLSEFFTRSIAGFAPSNDDARLGDAFLAYPADIPEVQRHVRLIEHLGAVSQGYQLEFPLFERDESEYRDLISRYGVELDNYVCLHPGARWPSRRWMCNRFAAVADALADDGLQIVLTGSNWEADLVEDVSRQMRSPHINLAGRTDLGLVARVIAGSRLLISNDTGISHIAAAVHIPSVVLILGSDDARWAPLDRNLHCLVRTHVACQPCEHFHCPTGHECAKEIPVSQVIEAARGQLERIQMESLGHTQYWFSKPIEHPLTKA